MILRWLYMGLFSIRFAVLWLFAKLIRARYALTPDSLIRIEAVSRQIQVLRQQDLPFEAFALADTMANRFPNEHAFYYLRAVLYSFFDCTEESFDDISTALDIAPRETDYWIFRARIYSRLQKFDQAIADLQQSIRFSRSIHPAIQWFEIGLNYLQMESFEQAVDAFREAVKDEEIAIPVYYYRLAQAHDQLLDYGEAERYLRHAVDLNFSIQEQMSTQSSTVYDRTAYVVDAIVDLLLDVYHLAMYVPTLCRFYFSAEKYEEALQLIARALEYMPDHHLLLMERGKCLRLLGDYQEALASFTRALEAGEQAEHVYVEQAHVYRLMGDEERALQHFLQAREADEHFPYLDYWIAGSYVVLDEPEQALTYFSSAIEKDEDDADCYLERAGVYEQLGQYGEAERDFEKLIELRDDEDARMNRALFFWHMDRAEDALHDIQTALEMDAHLIHNNRFCYLRGMLLMEIENYELAEADFARAMELDPTSEILCERRARCRMHLKKMEEALEDCNLGLQLNPLFEPLLWTRGFLLFEMGDYKGAVRDALEYLRLNPEDSSAHYNLGLVYMNLYEYKNALAQLSLAIARDPYHVEAYFKRAEVWEKLLDFDKVALDLANWVFYDRTERPYEQRVELLRDLVSFDELIIDDAIEHLKKMYGHNGPSLLH